MIEEEINDLTREVEHLRDQLNLVIKFLGSDEKDSLCQWKIMHLSQEVDYGYDSKMEAQQMVDSYKTVKGDRFRKGTPLADFSIGSIKVSRYLKGEF
tara:strand:+ start:74 stop:364 length:291 start_codon:yes stop_codon:yes gene_type:complete